MRIFNKKARQNYHILETFQAGIVLMGQEVKSLRAGKADINDSFAKIQDNQVYLKNAFIYPYQSGALETKFASYDPRQDRKLLLHKIEINKLRGRLSAGSMALIPLSIFTANNYFKVELALAGSKKKFDHRRAIKEKDERRRMEQELKGVK